MPVVGAEPAGPEAAFEPVLAVAEEPVVAVPVVGILSRAMLLAASQHLPESEEGAVVCALAKPIPATSIAAAAKAVILFMKFVLFRRQCYRR